MERQLSKSSQHIILTQSAILSFMEQHNDRGPDKILVVKFENVKQKLF